MADCCELFKWMYSSCLLILCIVIVMAVIDARDTSVAEEGDPFLAYIVMWLLICWLSVVEGGKASLVGLPPIKPDLYKGTHPITYQITKAAHDGDNLLRYLVGRQFLVVLIAYVINLCGSPVENVTVLGLPSGLQNALSSSGLAMALIVLMVGQLPAQVNASHCMLDFINTYSMLFTFYVAMAIEFSGLLHAPYLIRWVVVQLSGERTTSCEAPGGVFQNFFFAGRVVMSICILGFAFAVTITALFQGKTTAWDGVPGAVSLMLFLALLAIIGSLEGAQIAFFAVTKLRREERGTHPIATATCELLFGGDDGRNLPAFMIGRQIMVTSCFFMVAKITTLNVDLDSDDTIFGVSEGVQQFFNTGLLGAIITTTNSIVWELVASAFPLAFLRNPLVYMLLRIGLFLEYIGVCSAAWVLGYLQQDIAGYVRDEVYVGKVDNDGEMNDEREQSTRLRFRGETTKD
jgi:hypothetical protein